MKKTMFLFLLSMPFFCDAVEIKVNVINFSNQKIKTEKGGSWGGLKPVFSKEKDSLDTVEAAKIISDPKVKKLPSGSTCTRKDWFKGPVGRIGAIASGLASGVLWGEMFSWYRFTIAGKKYSRKFDLWTPQMTFIVGPEDGAVYTRHKKFLDASVAKEIAFKVLRIYNFSGKPCSVEWKQKIWGETKKKKKINYDKQEQGPFDLDLRTDKNVEIRISNRKYTRKMDTNRIFIIKSEDKVFTVNKGKLKSLKDYSIKKARKKSGLTK